MAVPTHFSLKGMGFAVLILLIASPAAAQIEDQLSAYAGENEIY